MRVVVLGAGFGGLELCTMLSESLGDTIEVTLIDKSDHFIFGYSKLDVMFGRKTTDEVRLHYRDFVKPGVRLLQETITAIDPEARRVTTNAGVHQADVLVVALGADYDYAATPGMVEFGNEFYSVEGAERLREVLPTFRQGPAVIASAWAPFKCPPAPSECALMLHDYLTARGVRQACDITLVLPLPSPVPPSPDTSRALLAEFSQRNIRFIANRRVASLDGARHVVVLDDGSELPYALFLGVPKQGAPAVVVDAGMTEGGWVPVNPRTLETKYPGVYAIGDGANTQAPKAGVFAEGAARAVGSALIAQVLADREARLYDGRGICYVEFSEGKVGRVEVDFFSGPTPTGVFQEPSAALYADKLQFGSSRRARWFGHTT